MRIAALYDIHGNLPALEAVLNQARDEAVDLIVVGGDVFPGPMSGEALACLQAADVPLRFLHGNGDRAVLELAETGATLAIPEAYQPAARWVARQLSAEQRRLMSEWPPSIAMSLDDLGDVLFCHASPRNDTDIFTRLTPEDRVRALFDGVDVQLVVCGHTHMQFDRMVGRVRVVNAGSVGMPFGEPGAYWLLLDDYVRLQRTAYDFGAAAQRIRASGYPLAEEFAAGNILQPPSEQTMLELFETR